MDKKLLHGLPLLAPMQSPLLPLVPMVVMTNLLALTNQNLFLPPLYGK
jgi:hypothetical protein